MEREKPIQLHLPDINVSNNAVREPLATKGWIEENSLRPGIDANDPEVLSLMREGVKPCEIVIIRLGR